MPGVTCLSPALENENQRGHRVGPPPPGRRVERDPNQHGRRERAIYQRDTRLHARICRDPLSCTDPSWHRPGRSELATQLTGSPIGVDCSDARRAALLELAGRLPAAIVADLLGVHVTTATKWAQIAGRPWGEYPAWRTQATRRGQTREQGRGAFGRRTACAPLSQVLWRSSGPRCGHRLGRGWCRGGGGGGGRRGGAVPESAASTWGSSRERASTSGRGRSTRSVATRSRRSFSAD